MFSNRILYKIINYELYPLNLHTKYNLKEMVTIIFVRTLKLISEKINIITWNANTGSYKLVFCRIWQISAHDLYCSRFVLISKRIINLNYLLPIHKN